MTAPARVLSANEPWAEYQLEDGTLLRFRLTVCNFRLTGKRTPEGDPEYSFSQQVQCETHARLQVASITALRPVDRMRFEVMPDIAPSNYQAPAEDCG